MLPTRFITEGSELTKDYANGNARPLDLQINWTNSETKTITKDEYSATYKVAHVYLSAIPGGEYTTGVTARMYYAGGENPEYSAAVERSYTYVAESALEDVSATQEGEYKNQAGSKYSPYTAAERDALIGVAYEKVTNATWDLHDGKLVTTGKADADSPKPFLLERTNTIDTSKDFFTIETSIYVPSKEAGQNQNGVVFAYNKDNSTYWILDVRYMNDKWYTNIRYYASDGSVPNQGFAGMPYEENTWYDFRVFVNKADAGQTKFAVDYKKSIDVAYGQTIELGGNGIIDASMTGTRLGFFTEVPQNDAVTLSYDASSSIDYTCVLGGKNGQTVKVNGQQLGADGTGTIEGQMVVDYRSRATWITAWKENLDISREGIMFGGNGTSGYMFYVTHGNMDGRAFYVGLCKVTELVKHGGFTPLTGNVDTAETVDFTSAGITLNDGDAVVVDYKVVITKNATTGIKTFTITYQFSKDGVMVPATTYTYTETAATNYNSGSVYLFSSDTRAVANGTIVSDGKTLYNSIKVTQ